MASNMEITLERHRVAAPAKSDRDPRIDAAKGVAIVLVVSFIMLLTINLLQAWARGKSGK